MGISVVCVATLLVRGLSDMVWLVPSSCNLEVQQGSSAFSGMWAVMVCRWATLLPMGTSDVGMKFHASMPFVSLKPLW